MDFIFNERSLQVSCIKVVTLDDTRDPNGCSPGHWIVVERDHIAPEAAAIETSSGVMM